MIRYPPPRRAHAEPDQGWWPHFESHRALEMPPQAFSWTCSICASTWVLAATGVSDQAREQTAGEIGYPSCVNSSVGLADTRCLLDMFAQHGLVAHQEWVDWARAWQICSDTTGVLNSTSWYHFVAIRGTRNGALWVANSAPGYRNIWDEITPGQFQAWAGSWQAVWLDR
jgi:hypothetical protein